MNLLWGNYAVTLLGRTYVMTLLLGDYAVTLLNGDYAVALLLDVYAVILSRCRYTFFSLIQYIKLLRRENLFSVPKLIDLLIDI